MRRFLEAAGFAVLALGIHVGGLVWLQTSGRLTTMPDAQDHVILLAAAPQTLSRQVAIWDVPPRVGSPVTALVLPVPDLGPEAPRDVAPMGERGQEPRLPLGQGVDETIVALPPAAKPALGQVASWRAWPSAGLPPRAPLPETSANRLVADALFALSADSPLSRRGAPAKPRPFSVVTQQRSPATSGMPSLSFRVSRVVLGRVALELRRPAMPK